MSRKHFCECMKCNRSSLDYEPKGESKENLELMEAMDKYYLGHPTAGVRTMVNMFLLQGKAVNAKRIRRLMRKMNLVPIYPQRSRRCRSTGMLRGGTILK